MPILTNIRHERFCHAICQNKTAAEAYRLAGYKAATQHTAEANGHRLMRNDEVKNRIAELQAPILQKDGSHDNGHLGELGNFSEW